jgi:glycerophosphoryl diester phosphodiesterase
MKKIFKTLIIIGSIIALVGVFEAVINIIPPEKVVEHNVFIKDKNASRPMLAAHRGGSLNNPENTLKAFKAAVNNYGNDIIESDIWLTKDEKIVFSHDKSIDRMSDVKLFDNTKEEHLISDYTLDELQNFNMGYGFKNKNNEYPYKDLVSVDQVDRKDVLKANDLQILEVEQLFNEYYVSKPDLLFIVEIKNGGEKGYKAANVLDDLLTNKYPNYKNNVVVGTFHDEIAKDLKANHPTILRGASTGEARDFVLTQMFGVNIFNKADFVCLQIPTSYNLKGIKFTLDKKTFINRAHRRNIAVQYWTINDANEMKHLAKLGCDCIMTDDPELFNEVFK